MAIIEHCPPCLWFNIFPSMEGKFYDLLFFAWLIVKGDKIITMIPEENLQEQETRLGT
jgi:hypothetical protein